jgi:glycosyltransferase involved in cell wall biosynthesis
MTTTQSRLTIGLPVYNGEQFLTFAIKSLLGQTFGDFRLLISDNASDDGTESICREFAAHDRRIQYIRQQENRGAAWNFNFVVGQANTELFKWAPHDDVHRPKFLEKCIDALDQDPDTILAYSRIWEIDENGTERESWRTEIMDMRERSKFPHERYRHFVLMDHPALSSFIFGVFRTEVLKRTDLIGSFVESDRVLLVALSLIGPFYEVPERLFLRRDHPHSSTKAIGVPQERAAWFNPEKGKHRIYPNWRKLYEYYRVLCQSKLPWCEKRKCYFTLLRWISWFRDLLWSDLKYQFRSFLRRPGAR